MADNGSKLALNEKIVTVVLKTGICRDTADDGPKQAVVQCQRQRLVVRQTVLVEAAPA